jgi:hypothetical protein
VRRKPEPEPEPQHLDQERLNLVHRYMVGAGEAQIEGARPETKNGAADLDVDTEADIMEPPVPPRAESPPLPRPATALTYSRPVSMDLLTVIGVLRRYRFLVGLGVVLAVVLAGLSYGRPGWSGGPTLRPTQAQVWKSSVVLFLTEEGFPEGRAIPAYAPSIDGAPPSQLGDQNRFADLALVYSQLANSDVVRNRAHVSGANLTAEPVTASTPDFSSTQILPMIKITAQAASPARARAAVNRLSSAFVSYVTLKQDEAGISKTARVDIQVLSAARGAQLVQGSKKTLSALVFVGILSLFAALILVLENIAKSRATAVRRERELAAARLREPAYDDDEFAVRSTSSSARG